MFGMFRRETGAIEAAVRKAVAEVMDEHAKSTAQEIGALGTIQKLRDAKAKLEDEIAELRLQKKQETREIEHKVGLARIRQEAEADIAEQKLNAREEQLEAQKDLAVGEARVAAREEAMKRADELLGAQVARMENLVDVLVKALPKAEMMVEMSGGKARK